MPVTLDYEIAHQPVAFDWVLRVAEQVLEGLELSDAELSLVLTDDKTIQQLNYAWRHKNKPTDVLSFSQIEGDTCVMPDAPGSPCQMLGDVVISCETALRQMQQFSGGDIHSEIARLIVHGTLHLLGYEHIHGGHQAKKMKNEELRLMNLLLLHSLIEP